MKTKIFILFLFVFALFQSCNAQQVQTALPIVENHLIGELDYTHEALELVQSQGGGEDLILGKINTDGTIHFNLPEFNIKAFFEGIPLEPYALQDWFSMDNSCKDKDAFTETPSDAIYSLKTKAIWVKKYGIYVAILETESNKKMVKNKDATRDSLAIIKEHFWFFIDRAITYKENCSKVSHITGDIDHTISVDIDFEKGWNFIEETTEWTLDDEQRNPNVSQVRKTQYSKSSSTSKNVKWSLRQVADNGKIQTAKSLYNLTPIDKEQFEKWVPNKLGDLSVTTIEHGNPPKGQKSKNNMHLIYEDKAKTKKIELYVIDAAKSPDDMEMVNLTLAMENDGNDEKDTKPYIAQYNEQKKTTRFMYKVEDRIVVAASAVNINEEELWDYIKKLNVEKLLKK